MRAGLGIWARIGLPNSYRSRCSNKFGGRSGGRTERVQECAGLGDDIFGFGRGEGPAEDALWCELGASFDVAADELHEDGGVDGVRSGGGGVSLGEFDV